jgi:hypothetical protein
MKTFGSGQTSGQPLLLTTTYQTLHTCPAGAATPAIVQVRAGQIAGTDSVNPTVTVGIYNSGGTLVKEIVQSLPDTGVVNVGPELVLNGTTVVKVKADAAAVVATALVDDQANVAGTGCQNIASGLVAAVQAASRFAVNAQGGTGNATEANANIIIAKAGVLKNLVAVSDGAVGGGATVTVAVRINGASSALSQTFANADGTTVKTDTDSVAVAVGDKVCFLVSCDNAGAPAANLQAAVQYIAS